MDKNTREHILIASFLLLLAIIAGMYLFYDKNDGDFLKVDSEVGSVNKTETNNANTSSQLNTYEINTSRVLVKIGDVEIDAELATTSAARQKGLSGRLSLGADEGMLFVFPDPHTPRFWMPDMHFPLDIIWINNGAVVDIDEFVTNEFDPKNPKYYTPSEPIIFVLEVNAGFVQKNGIAVGDPFSLIITSN